MVGNGVVGAGGTQASTKRGKMVTRYCSRGGEHCRSADLAPTALLHTGSLLAGCTSSCLHSPAEGSCACCPAAREGMRWTWGGKGTRLVSPRAGVQAPGEGSCGAPALNGKHGMAPSPPMSHAKPLPPPSVHSACHLVTLCGPSASLPSLPHLRSPPACNFVSPPARPSSCKWPGRGPPQRTGRRRWRASAAPACTAPSPCPGVAKGEAWQWGVLGRRGCGEVGA